jgi:hypothetical protein
MSSNDTLVRMALSSTSMQRENRILQHGWSENSCFREAMRHDPENTLGGSRGRGNVEYS